MVHVCGFYIKGLLESLISNCIASFIGSTVKRGNVGPMGERVICVVIKSLKIITGERGEKTDSGAGVAENQKYPVVQADSLSFTA